VLGRARAKLKRKKKPKGPGGLWEDGRGEKWGIVSGGLDCQGRREKKGGEGFGSGSVGTGGAGGGEEKRFPVSS